MRVTHTKTMATGKIASELKGNTPRARTSLKRKLQRFTAGLLRFAA